MKKHFYVLCLFPFSAYAHGEEIIAPLFLEIFIPLIIIMIILLKKINLQKKTYLFVGAIISLILNLIIQFWVLDLTIEVLKIESINIKHILNYFSLAPILIFILVSFNKEFILLKQKSNAFLKQIYLILFK